MKTKAKKNSAANYVEATDLSPLQLAPQSQQYPNSESIEKWAFIIFEQASAKGGVADSNQVYEDGADWL